MELKEISATARSPYRCYVRGNVIQSEGKNVFTVGFKDGLAVVQVMSGPTDTEKSTATTAAATTMTMTTATVRDNAIDSKAIDLTKLKKVIVKVDPQTGKKYIVRDGRRIEILPQVQNPVLNLTVATTQTTSLTTSASGGGADDKLKRNIIIKAVPQNFTTLGKIFNGTLFPKIAPKQAAAVVLNKQNGAGGGGGGVKAVDNFKYQVVSLSVKKSTSTSESDGKMKNADKGLQTDSLYMRDSCTQTEHLSGRDSPFSDSFFNFILSGDSEYNSERDCYSEVFSKKMIDPNKLKTKEEINKFNFFNDMRNALNFDRSGNLPIHESVMRNSPKLVQKHCIVLRAIRENVNIVNQQGYAPLHLAVLHDISIDIIKILLDHGADLSVADSEGNTAIHLAIENNRSDVLKVLVTWALQTGFSLDVFNYEGFTPLILACLNRSYNDAKLLLQHGADPNIKDMKSGRTALFHAAECFDVNLVELLMEYKADTKIRNFFGTSAHDAMFEVEDMPLKIKFCILGRDHQRFQNKKKTDSKSDKIDSSHPLKKAKLQTTPVLRRVNADDLNLVKSKRK